MFNTVAVISIYDIESCGVNPNIKNMYFSPTFFRHTNLLQFVLGVRNGVPIGPQVTTENKIPLLFLPLSRIIRVLSRPLGWHDSNHKRSWKLWKRNSEHWFACHVSTSPQNFRTNVVKIFQEVSWYFGLAYCASVALVGVYRNYAPLAYV